MFSHHGLLSRAVSLVVLCAVLPLVHVMAQAVQAPAQAGRPPSATSAKADKPLPDARTIIDRHVTAIGGRAAILARSSSHATGTVAIPSAGLTGTVDVFASKPDRMLLRVTLAGLGSLEEGFNGTIGWSLSPMTGPALVQGKELEQKRFDADFYADLHLPARYESMTTVESVTFEGRPCYKVRLVPRGGGEEFELYDVATGLKAGGISTRETPMGPVTGTVSESNYRKFGGLLQATTIAQTVMGVQQVITLTDLEYDKVSASVFDPPAEIKALVK